MNAPTTIEVPSLNKLREPFPAHHISKLPKPTKAQTEAVRNDFKKGIRCQICGTWHHPDVVHLDYVGHAALTDRLLDTDPAWFWEPAALTPEGLPAFDKNGGLWIKLTVCGVTRLGYGSADGKSGGDAVKEIIGDALRNAAMRFGAALDLWHKGDLHLEEGEEPSQPQAQPAAQAPAKKAKEPSITDEQRQQIMVLANAKGITAKSICDVGGIRSIPEMPAKAFDRCLAWLNKQPSNAPIQNTHASDVLEDEIPY